MRPCGLVHIVVLARECQHVVSYVHCLAKTTWFGIPDFCNVEEEWMEHGVNDHEVRNGNDI